MAKQWHQLERLDHKALKKLQAEREKAAKLAAAKAKQQQQIIIAAVVVVAIIGFISIIVAIVNKRDATNISLEKEKKMFSQVVEFSGTPEFRTTGDWETLSKNIEFNEEYIFRTTEDSSISIKTQEDNQTKMYPPSQDFPGTELWVKLPELSVKNDKVIVDKQIIDMVKGQVTVAISVAGKEKLRFKVAGLEIIGQPGLFKIRYNDEKDKGEVVVKNGQVDVISPSSEKPIKITGFYKVTFENGSVSEPSQASIIQYDWR